LAKQLAASSGVTEKERRWIALFEQQLEAASAPPAESEVRHGAYKRAVEELVALDPDDPHAWVLRGNAEEPGAWGRGQRGGVGSIAFYEAALRRDRDHLGAHHFLVHSYENVGRYHEAAEHGRIYAAAAPDVPHAQHMLGHVLPRLGLWQEARLQFEKADRLERAYYESQGVAPAEDWHHGHNLSVLGTVALRLGDPSAAERRFREAYALDSTLPNCAPWVEYLLLRRQNEAALEAAAACEQRGSTLARLVGASLVVEALLGLNRTEDARAALSRADAAARTALAEARTTPLAAFGPRLVRYRDVAAALVALQDEDPERGERELLRVADEIASSRSIDGWASGLYRLVRLADLARANGRPALAAALEERLRTVDPELPALAVFPTPGR
jgi:Tfp pilus assembly protein PilF